MGFGTHPGIWLFLPIYLVYAAVVPQTPGVDFRVAHPAALIETVIAICSID
jgi:hypothetical protein